jgi:DNA polymerase-3 subunit alpha
MHRKDPVSDSHGSSWHITLLALNDVGYKNLLKLTSKAHVEGFYYRPRIDLDCLADLSQGIFVLSGCMGGQLSSSVLQGSQDESRRIIRAFRNIFGSNYAIEVMWHGHEKQEALNRELLLLSKEFDIPAVATCDSHYARPEDAKSHDAMLAIQTGSTLDDPSPRFRADAIRCILYSV